MVREQSFSNHARVVPLFHGVTFFIFVANYGWSAYRLARDGFSGDRVMMLLVAVALILLFFFTRIFALTVQDRVIRHEMRARLRDLLPAAMHPRIGDFTVDHASDEELPELCARVLDEGIRDRKRSRNW